MSSARHRHAPDRWRPNETLVRYIARDDGDLEGRVGMFVGNSEPLPGVTPKSWLGVLVRFDGEDVPLDIDPDDLEVVAKRPDLDKEKP